MLRPMPKDPFVRTLLAAADQSIVACGAQQTVSPATTGSAIGAGSDIALRGLTLVTGASMWTRAPARRGSRSYLRALRRRCAAPSSRLHGAGWSVAELPRTASRTFTVPNLRSARPCRRP